MLAPRIARRNGFVVVQIAVRIERERNPAAVRVVRDPDIASRHPGYKMVQCASGTTIENCTGSPTYFSTADW
jgi:hypothetical protein